jgi:hypothetical protein
MIRVRCQWLRPDILAERDASEEAQRVQRFWKCARLFLRIRAPAGTTAQNTVHAIEDVPEGGLRTIQTPQNTNNAKNFCWWNRFVCLSGVCTIVNGSLDFVARAIVLQAF